jgi:hypothetical protein
MKPKKYVVLEAKMLGKGDTNPVLAEYLGIGERTLWKRRLGESYWTTRELKLLHNRYHFTDEEITEIVLN